MASRRNAIIEELRAAVGAISTSAGYQNDLPGGCQRINQAGNEFAELPMCVIGWASDLPATTRAANVGRNSVTVIVTGVGAEASYDVGSQTSDEWADSIVSDIERAVMSTAIATALDVNLEARQVEAPEEGQPLVKASVVFTVTYEARTDDPEGA